MGKNKEGTQARIRKGGGVAGTFQSKPHRNRPRRPLGLPRVGVRSGSVLKWKESREQMPRLPGKAGGPAFPSLFPSGSLL